MGAMWKEIDQATKAQYQKKVDAAKAQFEKDMAAFKKTPDYDAWMAEKQAKRNKKAGKSKAGKVNIAKLRKKMCPNKPKGTTTAYFHFVAEVRAETGKKPTEVAKIA